MTTIEQRLDMLEKANRRYRKIISFIIAITVIGLITAFTSNQVQDKIQAKAFEVIDNNRNVVISMLQENGGGHITTYNPQGYKQIEMLPNNAGGGSFVTYDGKGNMNLRITYTEGGGGSLGIYNGSGKQVLRFNNTTTGDGDIYIRSHTGDDRVRLTTTETGSGSITVFNNSSVKGLHISCAKESGIVNVYNSLSQRICALGTDDDGNGGLDCWNRSGTKTVTLPN